MHRKSIFAVSLAYVKASAGVNAPSEYDV